MVGLRLVGEAKRATSPITQDTHRSQPLTHGLTLASAVGFALRLALLSGGLGILCDWEPNDEGGAATDGALDTDSTVVSIDDLFASC